MQRQAEARVGGELDAAAQRYGVATVGILLELRAAVDGVDQLGGAFAQAHEVAQPQLREAQTEIERAGALAPLAAAP